MTATSDHVMGYALGRVFGRNDSELIDRILDRCHKGRLETSPTRLPASSPRRKTLLVAIAVSIAVCGVWIWPSARVASADTPVLSAHGEDWPPAPRTRFDRGEMLVVSEEIVRVQLAGSGTIEARPGTILRLDETDSLTLHFGSVQATSGEVALRVATAAGTIRLDPGATAEIAAFNDDYTLEPDFTLLELARRIHMLDTTLVVSLVATLLQGTGELTASGEVRALQTGVPVQQDTERDEAGLAQLQKEIGTWTVTVRIGDQEFTGTEVCRRGSGDHSIVSDIGITVGERRIETTVLISYDPERRRFSGTYVDSFGGELGLLLGAVSEDPAHRILQMNRFHGGEFGIRMRTQWVNDDERRTIMESLSDGEWETRRAMTHKRQPEPASDLFQVSLYVHDMQTQVEFYRDVLGLEVTEAEEVADFSVADRVVLSTGEMSLALRKGRQSENSGDEARLSFRVADLEAASNRVRIAGMPVGEARRTASGVSVVECRDPEGNAFHLELRTSAGR